MHANGTHNWLLQLASILHCLLTCNVLLHALEFQVGRSPEDSSACDVLMSAKEAAELEELLASFDMGLGESEAFAAALQVRSVAW
jgi:hypothetical protein